MPAAGVQAQFQAQCDNLAAYKKAFAASIVNRGSLWMMVNDSRNQVYEDAVLGLSIAAVDDILNEAQVGTNIPIWFNLQESYFRGLASGSIDGAVAAWGWRVHERFAQVYTEAENKTMTLTNVFPTDDFNFGTHTKTGDVWTSTGTLVDLTQSDVGMIQAVAVVVIGAATYTLTGTLIRADSSAISLSVSFAAASAAGTNEVFGQTVLGANAGSGQPTILVASTTAFAVGDKVFVQDSSNGEWGVIASIVTNISITLTANLHNTYTTAAGASVTPMYQNISSVTCGGTGSTGDSATVSVAPDRVVTLAYTPLYPVNTN